MQTYSEMKETKKRAKKLLEQVDEFIKQKNLYLSLIKISDKETSISNQNLIELRKKLEKERENIKSETFNDLFFKFEVNKLPVNEDFIGDLKYQQQNFSVS